MTEEKKTRKRPDEITKLIRALDKASVAAVERLVELCASEDQDIAFKAANSLLKHLEDSTAQAVDRDFKAIMLQAKLGQLVKPTDEEEDDTPEVDFNNLQKIT